MATTPRTPVSMDEYAKKLQDEKAAKEKEIVETREMVAAVQGLAELLNWKLAQIVQPAPAEATPPAVQPDNSTASGVSSKPKVSLKVTKQGISWK